MFTVLSSIHSLFIYSSFSSFPYLLYHCFFSSHWFMTQNLLFLTEAFSSIFPLFSSFLFCPKFLRKGEKTQMIIILISTLSVWWFLDCIPLCHYRRLRWLYSFLPSFQFFIFSVVLQQKSSWMVAHQSGASEMVSSIMGNSPK